jgi:fructokinase
MFGDSVGSQEAFCRTYADRFGLEGVCVTRGASGCAAFWHGEYVESPGYKVSVADTVGAGDAFAAAFLHGLASQWSIRKAADFANRLGALVASKKGAIPNWTMQELLALTPDQQTRRSNE